MAFKFGDDVQLRSGGPAMKVMRVGDSFATCAWLPERSERMTEMFRESDIKLCEPGAVPQGDLYAPEHNPFGGSDD